MTVTSRYGDYNVYSLVVKLLCQFTPLLNFVACRWLLLLLGAQDLWLKTPGGDICNYVYLYMYKSKLIRLIYFPPATKINLAFIL